MSPEEIDGIDKIELENDLKDTKEQVENFKIMGVNVEAAEIIITQAEKAMEEGNLQLAQTLIDSASKTAKLIKQQYIIQASSILFSSLKRTIMDLEGAGSEVSYIKDMYNKAKEMFDSGQYDDAMEYIKSAENMAHKLKAGREVTPLPDLGKGKDSIMDVDAEVESEIDESQQQMERVSKTLIRVDELLQEAIDNGYSVNEAEKLYSLAEDAFDYQDYSKAEEHALASEQSLEEILRPMHKDEEGETTKPPEKKTKADSGRMRDDMPKDDSDLGKDEKYAEIMPKGIIGDAPDATIEEVLEDENEDDIDEREVEIEFNLEEEVKEDAGIPIDENGANELLDLLEKKIKAAQELGLNTPMAERLLSIAESYYHRDEFDNGKEYLIKGLKQIDDIAGRKGKTEDLSAKLREWGVDVPDAGGKAKVEEKSDFEIELDEEQDLEEPLEIVIKKKAKHTSKKGPKKEKLKDSKKLKKSKLNTAQKFRANLKKIESEISETKELGLEVEDSEMLIEQAFEELENNNLALAKQLGLRAQERVRDSKRDFIKQKALDLVKVGWKEIASAAELGVDTSEANSYLEYARKKIKKGDYEEAAKLAMEAIQQMKEIVEEQGE